MASSARRQSVPTITEYEAADSNTKEISTTPSHKGGGVASRRKSDVFGDIVLKEGMYHPKCTSCMSSCMRTYIHVMLI